MAKYIDADKLKRFEEMLADIIVSSQGLCTYEACKDRAKIEAPVLIDELQQEQPSEDLEVRKQIEELANDWHHKGFASDEDCPLCMQDLIDILWYFYELGKVLNARKEE